VPATPLSRICYVEDDEDIQRIVRMSLERVGKMTVHVVSDPMQAIEAIKVFKPDLVMLDWMMPGWTVPHYSGRCARHPRSALAGRFHHGEGVFGGDGRAACHGRGGCNIQALLAQRLADQLRSIWGALP